MKKTLKTHCTQPAQHLTAERQSKRLADELREISLAIKCSTEELVDAKNRAKPDRRNEIME